MDSLPLVKHMKYLPLELYVKIMYKSGLCSPEAQLIKDMMNNLIIPYENVIWISGGQSYINHLIHMGILRESIEHYGYGSIEYIYFIG